MSLCLFALYVCVNFVCLRVVVYIVCVCVFTLYMCVRVCVLTCLSVSLSQPMYLSYIVCMCVCTWLRLYLCLL